MSASAITLHGTKLSGHAHRVELLLRMLSLPYAYRDVPAAVRSTPAFLALNPLGQIPVLEDGDLVLADSTAILVYLAKRYDRGGRWLPEAPEGTAAVQRWLSVAAGEIRYGPATARSLALWSTPPGADPTQAEAIAGRLLAFMDGHLAARPEAFLAANHPTLADLACYSYVAHAPEGGILLEPYPAVRAWLERVEALPGFEPMPRSPVPATA
jgi:glutathione S-transferase